MSETVAPNDNPDRDRAAELFAVGWPVGNISLALAVTERTIYRWLKDPAVRQRVEEVRSAALSACTGKVQGILAESMDQLRALVGSEDERVSLAAVRTAADITLKLRAFEEYDARLKAVEALLAPAGKGREVPA